jgi:DNA mismatch repair protein MutS
MVEMTETARILNTATSQSLVILDEIGRGTSTYDGLSLAWACANHIGRSVRAFTLFATHYFELTSLAAELEGCANVHLDATEHGDKLIFLHTVKEGPANQSYGLQVAALAGVPQKVITAARRYLRELERRSAAAHEPRPQQELLLEVPAEPVEHEVVGAVRALDPDAMTPKEALEAIYALKKTL